MVAKELLGSFGDVLRKSPLRLRLLGWCGRCLKYRTIQNMSLVALLIATQHDFSMFDIRDGCEILDITLFYEHSDPIWISLHSAHSQRAIYHRCSFECLFGWCQAKATLKNAQNVKRLTVALTTSEWEHFESVSLCVIMEMKAAGGRVLQELITL